MSIYSIRTMDVEPDLIEKNAFGTPNISGNEPFSVDFETGDERRGTTSPPEPSNPSLQRFEHKSLLGAGAYGEVWLAQDQMVERPVAVKQLIKQDHTVLDNVKKEAALGARVAHPGTPTIYDIGLDEDGQFRVIMEYMEGESLAKIIERLRSGDPQAHEEYPFHVRAEMVTQLLRVLVAAHQKQIVHCDIKPENVLVGASKEVYLCDWGIAYDLNTGPRTRIMGTPNFMAPEQLTLKELDGRADLFGVAAMAYQFLSLHGWHPYCDDIKVYLNQKLTHQPKMIDRVFHQAQGYVPSEYKAWVHKGLSLSPEDRHQSASEMLKELEDIQNGIFCVVCPRTFIKHWNHRYLKALDRHPEAVMALSAAILVGLAAGFFCLGAFVV